MNNEWLVVRTYHKRETWACENITRQGALVYAPRFAERVMVGRKGAKKIIERTKLLFPSYIFVKTDGQWRFLLSTFGVLSIVMQGATPAVMQDSVVADLRDREDHDGLVRLPTPPNKERFARGSKVRVVEGSFSGCVGIYEGTATHDREKVLLEFLGRRTRVLIGSNRLESSR